MNQSRFLTALCAAVLPAALALAAQGCGNKDNETPAQPSAAPIPTPTPTPSAAAPPVELKTEEDAGADAADTADAADGAVKATGSGADPTGVRKCCSALRQNANSAPLDQKGPMLSAAAMCDGLVNSPQGRQALVAVRGLLKGASVPSSCQ